MAQEFIVRTVRGLEWVAAAEVEELPDASVTAMRERELLVRAEQGAAMVRLRCADDVFAAVAARVGVGVTKDQLPLLARWTARLDLGPALLSVRSIRPLPRCPTYDVVVSLRGGRRFTRYDVEDTVGAALTATLGPAYRSRRAAPVASTDLTVRCFLAEDRLTLGLRLGGAPLHRRGYKQATGQGTLHPPVAAAMARLVGSAHPVLDPCCGDGTIPIESAAFLDAAPPGAGSRRERVACVVAADIDASRLSNAGANADRAGADVSFLGADAAALPFAAGRIGAIVSNPPWAVGVGAAGRLAATAEGDLHLPRLVDEMDRVLSPAGTVCLLLGVNEPTDPAVLATRLAHAGLSVGLVQSLRVNGRVAVLLRAGRSGTWPAGGPPSTSRQVAIDAWWAKALDAHLITDNGF